MRPTDRGAIPFTHVYSTSRRGRQYCSHCGQNKPTAKQRRRPEVILMMLHKGWRLSAYPLSYRVERLKPCQWSPGQNPTWQEVQRLPRTRNTYIEQEHQCAVSMLHRCFNKALAKQEHGYDPLSPKANLDGVYAVGYVKQQLYGWPRYRYALRVALPMWLYDQHEWNKLMWREWNKLMWRVRTKLKAWRYRWVD